jgi:Na+-transporting methylmalonyl-CoA/oxaloacetate decarboxylase gamma subunit
LRDSLDPVSSEHKEVKRKTKMNPNLYARTKLQVVITIAVFSKTTQTSKMLLTPGEFLFCVSI